MTEPVIHQESTLFRQAEARGERQVGAKRTLRFNNSAQSLDLNAEDYDRRASVVGRRDRLDWRQMWKAREHFAYGSIPFHGVND